jgi:hypothetical protein
MDIGGGFATGMAALAFFGCIAVCQWISARTEEQKRLLAHEARMRALELGKPLPEDESEPVVRPTVLESYARAEMSRARAAGTIGTLVPITLTGAAVGTTAIVFDRIWDTDSRIASVAIIWGVCGLVNLVTLAKALGLLRQRGGAAPPSPEAKSRPARYSESAFTDKPPSL